MIIGAGLAGLLAAHAFPGHRIREMAPGPRESHKALLRFRSSAVAELTGVDFKPVTVRKGIFHHGKFHAPNILLANLYSTKTLGRILDRSIWNLDSVTRYIAPENFYDQLLDAVGDRIDWDCKMDFRSGGTIISTAPLPAATAALGIDTGLEFSKAPIKVQRFRVPNANAYQTIYFPGREHQLYRASISEDLMICEFSGSPEQGDWMRDVMEAFGFDEFPDFLGEVDQKYGKIVPVEDAPRQAAISKLTENGIFSVGRFATWRNILLDDIVHDLSVVRRLIKSGEYARRLIAAAAKGE